MEKRTAAPVRMMPRHRAKVMSEGKLTKNLAMAQPKQWLRAKSTKDTMGDARFAVFPGEPASARPGRMEADWWSGHCRTALFWVGRCDPGLALDARATYGGRI